MLENSSITYRHDTLYIDDLPLPDIAAEQPTPFYVYSVRRALNNLLRIRAAFSELKPHIHYSAKANANLVLLRALIGAGAGIDAVSAGEIHRALKAGAQAENIVFAGVGKSQEEIRYALEQGVGWFNVENVRECSLIDNAAHQLGKKARVALRLNPDLAADTHRHIATGHGKAKFGLTAESIRDLLQGQYERFPNIEFAGIHIHIGSNLHSTEATRAAIERALELIAPYPHMRTVNIGGGLPVAYRPGEQVPAFETFAETITPLLKGYEVLLEPGRAVIADAGVLVTKVLYIKQQAGETFVICDASMSELIRPALYEAHHEIVQVQRHTGDALRSIIAGPVCETTDVLGKDVSLNEPLHESDLLAVLTAGAYGMVMSSNYNQRPRPAEIVVNADGKTWQVARRRETLEDLLRFEE
ncbi:MAG: diaminopimelate decarboxylase [Anaerolineae bacterium]